MMPRNPPLATALLVLALAFVAAGPAAAQRFPAKPVKLIVGFPPGGAVDVVGRLMANRLSAVWGQPVVVENRPGAAGNIASELAARSAADGYTLIIVASSHVSNGPLYGNLPYDPVGDFTPISQITYYSLVLVTHPSLAAVSVRELVALAKSQPGRLAFNSAGSGTPTHLTAELFRSAAGIDIVHVPYKGSAAQSTDLLGGQVQLAFSNPIVALPHVKTGRLRALATTGARRSPVFPDVPTMAESGFPEIEAGTWHAFLGPAGMARETAARIAEDLRAVLRQADVRERLAATGVEPIGTSPDELAAIMRSELARWTSLVRSARLKAD